MAVKLPLIPFEERVANKVLETLPISELVAQIKQTNDLVSRLILLNEELAQITKDWMQQKQENQEFKLSINSALSSIVSKFVSSLSKLGLPSENPSFMAAQRVLVPAAGTAIQLPEIPIPFSMKVTIRALSTNGGIIYVGNSKFEAESPDMSYPLIVNQEHEYEIRNLSQLWINSTVNSEGITWTVERDEIK